MSNTKPRAQKDRQLPCSVVTVIIEMALCVGVECVHARVLRSKPFRKQLKLCKKDSEGFDGMEQGRILFYVMEFCVGTWLPTACFRQKAASPF